MSIKVHSGERAPDYALFGHDGKIYRIKDMRGKRVLLYFYPKDNTPGCTTEAEMIRDRIKEFEHTNTVVFGVSPDSVDSHKKFAEKLNLPFVLLADPERTLIDAYGVWGKKKFMGKEYEGVLRTSFLIDEKGKIMEIYEDVKPKEHADEVLTYVCSRI